MYTWQIKETSKTSSKRALNRALKKAKRSVKGSPHSDIFLIDIHDTSDEWHAILNIIAEEKDVKKGHISYAPAPDSSLIKAQEEEEEEKEKIKKNEEAYRHQSEDYNYELLVRAHEREDIIIHENIEAINLYAEAVFEEEVMDVAKDHNFTSIHFIAKGSLWQTTRDLHPDLDLYNAVHEHQNDVFGETPSLSPGRSRKPRPGKRTVIAPEVTDE